MKKRAAPNMAHSPAQPSPASQLTPLISGTLVPGTRIKDPLYLCPLNPNRTRAGPSPHSPPPPPPVLQGSPGRSTSGQDSWISQPLPSFVPPIWHLPPLPGDPIITIITPNHQNEFQVPEAQWSPSGVVGLLSTPSKVTAAATLPLGDTGRFRRPTVGASGDHQVPKWGTPPSPLLPAPQPDSQINYLSPSQRSSPPLPPTPTPHHREGRGREAASLKLKGTSSVPAFMRHGPRIKNGGHPPQTGRRGAFTSPWLQGVRRRRGREQTQ